MYGFEEYLISPDNIIDGSEDESFAEGHFSQVYCVDVKLKEKVVKCAKKTLKDNFSQKGIKAFLRECEILVDVKHFCVIQFIGFGLYDSESEFSPCIFLKYAPNKSLDHYLYADPSNTSDEKKKELSRTQKQIILYGIAFGMRYLHNNGILHLDLKCLNVLLDKHFYPKITDFGLSVKNHQNSCKIKFATPAYLAPEISDDCVSEFPSSLDVYSFGILAYELISGKSYAEEFQSHRDPEKRPEFSDDIIEENPQLIELIQSCWDKEPKNRPSFSSIVEKLRYIHLAGSKSKKVNKYIAKCDDYENSITKIDLDYILNDPNINNFIRAEIDNSLNSPEELRKIAEKFSHGAADWPRNLMFANVFYDMAFQKLNSITKISQTKKNLTATHSSLYFTAIDYSKFAFLSCQSLGGKILKKSLFHVTGVERSILPMIKTILISGNLVVEHIQNEIKSYEISGASLVFSFDQNIDSIFDIKATRQYLESLRSSEDRRLIGLILCINGSKEAPNKREIKAIRKLIKISPTFIFVFSKDKKNEKISQHLKNSENCIEIDSIVPAQNDILKTHPILCKMDEKHANHQKIFTKIEELLLPFYVEEQ